MSYIETPTQTLEKFAKNPTWNSEPIEVLATDFFSIGNETNLLWNPYFYEEKDGRLFDPIRKKQIAGTANEDVVEEGINKQLEDWFLSHESGLGVWISPRGGGARPYPEEQITIYRIAYKLNGDKVLLCSSCQFKADFKNPEDIRRFVFTEDDQEKSVFEIISWLQKTSQKEVKIGLSDTTEKRRQAEFYAFQYKSGVSIEEIAYQMRQDRFLGENPIGCRGTKSSNSSSSINTESVNSNTESGDGLGPSEFTCPACGHTNIRPYGGYVLKCQNPNCSDPDAVRC